MHLGGGAMIPMHGKGAPENEPLLVLEELFPRDAAIIQYDAKETNADFLQWNRDVDCVVG
jgi:hypothetical protein